MSRIKLKEASVAGIISGILLGLFLKVAEEVTTLKVYTLLLNVDYIPILNRVTFPEIIEFGFHLIISVLLSIVLMVYIQSQQVKERKRIPFVIIVSLILGILLYPTTAFSDRTPALNDFPALFLWLLGHALYGYLLGFLFKKMDSVK